MDPRLLDYYNRELAFVREMGQEFAQEHPKIASRLGMSGTEVADPYVERLLEGFALLSGRIQLKMDAEFPRFSERLLELVYPHYLAPTPSMGIVKFHPSENDGGMSEPFTLPRHSLLRAPISRGQVTACQFRTAHAVELQPIRLSQAAIEGPSGNERIPQSPAKSMGRLRLELESHCQRKFSQIDMDQLPIYIGGPFNRALQLLELICGRRIGVTVHWSHNSQEHSVHLPASAVEGMGFDPDEALIPYEEHSFSGYRLLHEYFACPDRYRFFRLCGLRSVLQRVETNRLQITIHFDRECPELEKVVSLDHFHLFCTPVINLFRKRGDRVVVSLANFEHHLLGDRTRPLDYEIYSVASIQGYAADNSAVQSFWPIYETRGTPHQPHGESYFSVRREPRKLSYAALHHGPRTGYIGSEIYTQIVDRQHAPHASQLVRIAPDMLCSNRDLPMLIPDSAKREFQLAVSAPVECVELISQLTRPSPAIAERKSTWRLISHLQLNFHTLTDSSPSAGASAMRELLALYAGLSQGAATEHVEAVTSMCVAPVHVRVPQPGPIVYGRGVDIGLQVERSKFAGASPWLFGAVLEQFFARHTGINCATRLAMRTLEHGDFAQWPVRMGKRPQA